jgi:hypothetical protein
MQITIEEDRCNQTGQLLGEIWKDAHSGAWIHYRQSNVGNITPKLLQELEDAETVWEAEAAFDRWIAE